MKPPQRSSRQPAKNNCGTDPSPQSPPPPPPPEFFKVYIPTFNYHQLRLPPDFSKQCAPIPRKAVLRGRYGRSWRVGMIETARGLLIRSGWPEFVQDNALKYGDCLIFQYDMCSVFSVKIFGRNGCRKERRDFEWAGEVKVGMEEVEERINVDEEVETSPSLTRSCKGTILVLVQLDKSLHSVSCDSVNADSGTEAGSPEGDQTRDSTEGPGRPKHPHCMFHLTKWRFRQLHLSARFLRLNGIKMKRELILRNERGKRWTAVLGRKSDGQPFFTSGWPKFRKDNGIQMNQRCVVEFVVDSKDNECGELCFSMVP